MIDNRYTYYGDVIRYYWNGHRETLARDIPELEAHHYIELSGADFDDFLPIRKQRNK